MKHVIVLTILMCLTLAVCVLAMTEAAYAQPMPQNAPDAAESKLPGKLEMGLAIGSIIAMIGVIKFV